MNDRRVGTALNAAVRQRNYRRARDRALAKLAQIYPETYQDLLQREKESDEQLGKKWLDIDGTTGTSVVVETSRDGFTHWSKSGDGGTHKGDNGGEA